MHLSGPPLDPPSQSPRPTPKFFEHPCFSHRKRTPNRLPPPRAPVKSCPPLSRIFSSPYKGTGARFVSFLSESHDESLNHVSNPHYDPSIRQPFFEQCFEVVCKLGEGSFGEVFKVKSKEDKKLYAIKRSRQRFRGNDDRTKKLHEVKRHEMLSPHPNCIRFYKAWEEKLHLYIMTELCLMSLAEYAYLHGKVPENRVWNILLDLTQGLKHLHDNRLCHLDVKPENFFIAQDGFTCKLGDFGLTVSMDGDLHDASEGDSRYIASELLQGKFSPAADVFSLGISLLELACDIELPSEGKKWHELRNGQLPEAFINELSPNLLHILMAMMHPDPDQRLTVDKILAHPAVSRTALIRPFINTTRATGTVLKYVYSQCTHWMVSLFTMVLILLRLSPWRSGLHSPSNSLSSSISSPLNVTPITHNESAYSRISMETTNISDSDEELEALSRSFQGQSSPWTSSPPPQPHPSVRYSGSPIPINFNEHLSSNGVSSSPLAASVAPAPIRTSSPMVNNLMVNNSSVSRVVRSCGGARRQMVKNNVNIGPRNLMDMFNESAATSTRTDQSSSNCCS